MTRSRALGAVLLCGLAAFTAGGTPLSALAALPSFHTPSGNIGCIKFGGQLRCDIGQKSWHGPAQHASCPLAYGDSFTLRATGRPIWTCHGDTALHLGRALPYGTTWRSGPFTCISRITGLSCANRQGHGFFLSRQYYRTF